MNLAVAALGILVLLAGAFLVIYSEVYTESVHGVTLITGTERPYQNLGFILLGIGSITLALGFFMSKPEPVFS